MIDIENCIFTRLKTAILAKYPDAAVWGDYVEQLAQFPAVTIAELNNVTLEKMQDEAPAERFATITYEVNVYCDDRVGKKEVCKDILKIVDNEMLALNFSRRPARRLPAINRSIYRMYTRYTAVVDEGSPDPEDEDTIVHLIYRG